MIDMALNGKSVVKCDRCGIEIEYCGWMPMCKTPNGWFVVDDEHYCDECFSRFQFHAHEFRVCDVCGQVMTFGFCNEEDDHVCEECWNELVAREYPDGFRETPEDEMEEDDDYYQAYDANSGEWYVTSWYWTQWV